MAASAGIVFFIEASSWKIPPTVDVDTA